ncbi:glycosyltransferase family 4 protein [Formosa sp. A9]|uniref:glycosyltransferase family 4 protein n=1 Tax=Formosa sp. A9 TaxID=3442641 RepID=UPI003EBC7E43
MKVNYIFRKRLQQFNSIEELFYSIKAALVTDNLIKVTSVPFSGGSPNTILKNLKAFSKEKETVYHITGDVHYMALVTGKKTILTIHDIGSAFQGNVLKQLYIKLFWFWLPAIFVKKITVISEFTKKELSKIIPFAIQKIVVIPNPVNSKLNYTPETFNTTSPQILLIGTKPNKNLERTFEALQGVTCKLYIVGKLTEKQSDLLKKYNLEFINVFHVPYDSIVKAYQDSDLVLFASTYEGFGMPIIEAQAIGRPVVTSGLGAMKEVANNSACLVDPYDVKSIRDGVQRVIDNAEFRGTLIDQGKENIKRFQLEIIAKQYQDLYKSI